MEEEDTPSTQDDTNLDNLVNSMVQYIIARQAIHQPIKRSDIVKNALPGNAKRFKAVMALSKEEIEEVFGLKVVDLDNKEKNYITVSKFTSEEHKKLLNIPVETRNNKILLQIVLGYIFMNGNTITEDMLWKLLKDMTLVKDAPNYIHPVFGNVRHLFTVDFVRQMYFNYDKVPETNPPVSAFSWGPRADAEFSKREILNFVGKMQADVDPQRFTMQWAKMLEEEEAAKKS